MIDDRRHRVRPHRCISCGTTVVDNAAVCEDCWDKRHSPIGAKLLSATREQLIEEVLRLRGELAEAQRRTAHAAKVILKGDTAL